MSAKAEAAERRAAAAAAQARDSKQALVLARQDGAKLAAASKELQDAKQQVCTAFWLFPPRGQRQPHVCLPGDR